MSAYETGQNFQPDIPAERWREMYMEAAAEIERLRSAINAAVAAEREACRNVVEECIRTQAHLASNAREALSEASARIYKRGRTGPNVLLSGAVRRPLE